MPSRSGLVVMYFWIQRPTGCETTIATILATIAPPMRSERLPLPSAIAEPRPARMPAVAMFVPQWGVTAQ